MAKKKRSIIVKNHILIPEHSKLNQKEKKELLEKYGITTKELPKIMIFDPLAQKLNAQIDDVIEIKRTSQTAGEILSYRAVADE